MGAKIINSTAPMVPPQNDAMAAQAADAQKAIQASIVDACETLDRHRASAEEAGARAGERVEELDASVSDVALPVE
ncbi:MAG: hypothetical protein AAFR10_21460, partial [Pseudomonadota bacterium]